MNIIDDIKDRLTNAETVLGALGLIGVWVWMTDPVWGYNYVQPAMIGTIYIWMLLVNPAKRKAKIDAKAAKYRGQR